VRGVATMDRFIAPENIKHFHLMPLSDIAPEQRLRVQELLLEEEDKLGKDLELLAQIERHIADGKRRIREQQVRIRPCSATATMVLPEPERFWTAWLKVTGFPSTIISSSRRKCSAITSWIAGGLDSVSPAAIHPRQCVGNTST